MIGFMRENCTRTGDGVEIKRVPCGGTRPEAGFHLQTPTPQMNRPDILRRPAGHKEKGESKAYSA